MASQTSHFIIKSTFRRIVRCNQLWSIPPFNVGRVWMNVHCFQPHPMSCLLTGVNPFHNIAFVLEWLYLLLTGSVSDADFWPSKAFLPAQIFPPVSSFCLPFHPEFLCLVACSFQGFLRDCSDALNWSASDVGESVPFLLCLVVHVKLHNFKGPFVDVILLVWSIDFQDNGLFSGWWANVLRCCCF